MRRTKNMSMKSVSMSNMNVRRVKMEPEEGQRWTPKCYKEYQISKRAVFHIDSLWIAMDFKEAWSVRAKSQKSAPGGCQEQNFEIKVGGRGGGLLIE